MAFFLLRTPENLLGALAFGEGAWALALTLSLTLTLSLALALAWDDSHGEGRPSQETNGLILVLRICRRRDISSITRKMLMTATTARMATDREIMTASSGICESSSS